MGKPLWFSLMMIVSLWICCEQCSIAICFKWKVSFSSLTLICKVNRWNHRIFIDNQFGRGVADCIPDKCHPYDHNASIIQRLTTNETIYTMYGQIDNKVNGNWTCRHGTNLDVANVEVTVLKGEQKLGDTVIKKNAIENCTESLIFYALVGFVAMIAVCAASHLIKEIYCKGKLGCCRNTCNNISRPERDLQKRALIGIFILLLSLFGIPMLVSFLETKTCTLSAFPAMVMMGMTLGGVTGILFFIHKKEILPETDQRSPVTVVNEEARMSHETMLRTNNIQV